MIGWALAILGILAVAGAVLGLRAAAARVRSRAVEGERRDRARDAQAVSATLAAGDAAVRAAGEARRAEVSRKADLRVVNAGDELERIFAETDARAKGRR